MDANVPTYKWSSPADWLLDRIAALADAGDRACRQCPACAAIGELASVARELAEIADADRIQDRFQSDMERDGYFTALRAPRWDKGRVIR